MLAVQAQVRKECRDNADKVQAASKDGNYWATLLTRHGATLGKKVDRHRLFSLFASCSHCRALSMQVSYLLATGNLLSRSGLDLMQVSGYTVLAERLNFFRFVSHFQSVHRGAFFSEMKTTTVRKLLPESFGFLCPVHTPDGAPCGLLNHLAAAASVLTSPPEQPLSPDLLISLGVTPSGTGSADGGHVMPKVPRTSSCLRPCHKHIWTQYSMVMSDDPC